ncbi:BON domain-containing protein [Pseudoduganella sp. DS3]|uniref:Osmotically-inducible protein Y n=1 Tax=Pseudoduganella guangdongensis TaxID=2692179 RepID=A0A6N9HFB5_9BURK|nr:BON domain-containing protein [Pseudoduganella guangdongensis]MYN01743.1 BON domain-containing protein [Pseudoduganella guangdongensis]
MKKILCISLAALFSSSVAFAQTVDNNAYKAAKDRAESDYKAAKDRCKELKGNAEDVCKEEAKVAQARAELDATTQHHNTAKDVEKSRRKLADAEYELAKERCDDMSGSTKSACKNDAKSAHKTALASVNNPATSTTAAIAQDARQTGSNMADTAREKTADTRVAMSDTMITTKVKAEMAADPLVKAMDVHVETQKGIVMLSGFVPSKAEADKAVELARKVEGVQEVKSSIQVKK